jgi:hypothetical protein
MVPLDQPHSGDAPAAPLHPSAAGPFLWPAIASSWIFKGQFAIGLALVTLHRLRDRCAKFGWNKRLERFGDQK